MKDFVYKYENAENILENINTLCLYNYGENQIKAHPHNHDGWEIGYVMSGSGYYHLDGKAHPIAGGDLILTLPGDMHHESSSNNGNTEILFLIFNSSFSPKERFKLTFNSSLVLNTRNNPEIEQILRSILMETFEHRYGFEYYIEAEITRLFIYVFRLFANICADSQNINSLLGIIDMRKNKIIFEIKKYMEDNLLSTINISDIASKFYISPQHLIRLFKDVTKQTPKEYVTELKIAKACELLLNTSEDISAIAEKLGYASLQHFYISFKKKMSVTPVQYRNSPQALSK
jgi:AraC-like DNA-binding protein